MRALAIVRHAANPLSPWSWGYLPVLNRVHLLYGDAVAVEVYQGVPWDGGFDSWLEHYGMTWEEYVAWIRGEVGARIRVPILRDLRRDAMPASCLPPTVAAIAARRQAASDVVARFERAATFAGVVEGKDVSSPDALARIARDVGLDEKRLLADMESPEVGRAVDEELRASHRLGLTFYGLQVHDPAGGRWVALDYAYDAARVESAIDWIAKGAARRRELPKLGDYVARHAPVSAEEVATVYGLDREEAVRRLDAAGKRRAYAAGPFWVS